jgi:hypothetical protein
MTVISRDFIMRISKSRKRKLLLMPRVCPVSIFSAKMP